MKNICEEMHKYNEVREINCKQYRDSKWLQKNQSTHEKQLKRVSLVI